MPFEQQFEFVQTKEAQKSDPFVEALSLSVTLDVKGGCLVLEWHQPQNPEALARGRVSRLPKDQW
jgi:hypothetical protein